MRRPEEIPGDAVRNCVLWHVMSVNRQYGALSRVNWCVAHPSYKVWNARRNNLLKG